ncbi:hypothetical protein [Catellatospora citrea]|uniref:Uncharacterized protein n=1 Tax=Catellatospora citrea TaxID=53366 RepID=A0A8J3KHE7_9ACTN|nr:hypothetical protein [Catellatospora citrea]GIG03222.1 hypothetical protein Cci01nite_83150 [Catellatospora citrea]
MFVRNRSPRQPERLYEALATATGHTTSFYHVMEGEVLGTEAKSPPEGM